MQVPNLCKMDPLSAALWLCQNTYPKGWSKPNPLAGATYLFEVKEILHESL